jgi:hypothetical protein
MPALMACRFADVSTVTVVGGFWAADRKAAAKKAKQRGANLLEALTDKTNLPVLGSFQV